MQTFEPIQAPLPDQPRRPARPRIATACETCRRRRERCSGGRPCERCAARGVGRECYFVERGNDRSSAQQRQKARRTSAPWPPYARQEPAVATERPLLHLANSPTISEQYSRLIRDRKGSFMFIGDSANLSFLQIIRRVASECVGPCPFLDDPLRYFMVEASPEGQPKWLDADVQRKPPHLTLAYSRILMKWFTMATDGILDLFDEAELDEQLSEWIENRDAPLSIPSPMFCLMLAIGAQTTPPDKDELAENLFAYGRFAVAQKYMEDASLPTVQSYTLITMYLLNAARRNAAFMNLGVAVRAACAIGLHRKEIAATFPAEECAARERLWKALRRLDLFMSASLGRPPATTETRDTEADEDYSASNDLGTIFEKILIDVYSRRMVSTDVLTHIGSHQRRWASRFFRGLTSDSTNAAGELEDGTLPSIGLLHVKMAYYWSIILLTRPFLVESVALHSKAVGSSDQQPSEPCTRSDSNKTLINACVDSAMRIVDLLKGISGHAELPKRLPLLTNSVFIAALTLGFAYFGDLYQNFPLQRHLVTAQRFLARFSHDVIAQRNAGIVEYLRLACEGYVDQRTAQNMHYQSLAIGSMFGQIHRVRSETPGRVQTAANRCSQENGLALNEGDPGMDLAAPAPDTPSLAAEHEDTAEEYTFELDDLANTPFPPMTPRTLWFDTLDMPLFSTISNSNVDFDSLLG